MSWFYAKHGKQEGPVEETELRSKMKSGEVGADDLVWREGMAEWTPAGKVTELATLPLAEAPRPSAAGPGGEGGPPPAAAAPPPPGAAPPPGGVAMQSQPAPGAPMIYTPPPTSGLAIASMVLGIIGLMACYVWALPGIPAVICGHLALNSMRRSAHAVEGRGMAITGLITGYLAIMIQVLAIIGIIWFINVAPSTMGP
jgi:hypothetical protein